MSFVLSNLSSGHVLESTTEMTEEYNQLKYRYETPFTPHQADPLDDGKKQDKSKQGKFRQYTDDNTRVREFYKEQHTRQTVEFNIEARKKWAPGKHGEMGMWEALELLNSLTDQSDPDTDLSQIDHALQSAEAMRRDGQPRWMQLVALIHDAGKLLNFFDAPGQWAVVGDTFPVGCQFSDKIVYGRASFAQNPDAANPMYNTPYGIYVPGCGLENIMLSFGHDEYLYSVLRDYLPEPALAMIRFHSFYPWHRENAYGWIESPKDRQLKEWVRQFNPYDLYSKADRIVDVDATRQYYKDLIDEFLPPKIRW